MSRPFPLLICDDTFTPDPRGVRAFSYDDINLGLAHPLPIGQLAFTRNDESPTGSETLAEIGAREKDGWPVPFWVYYLVPVDPRVRVIELAEAAGTTVEDLLGIA